MSSLARQTNIRLKTSRITKREKDMIVSLFLDGYRPAEIADQICRGYITVAAAITDAGYTSERYVYSEEEAKFWVDMYEGKADYDRHCVREIAEAFNCPPSRVSTALLRRGARMRHPALAIRISAEKRRRDK